MTDHCYAFDPCYALMIDPYDGWRVRINPKCKMKRCEPTKNRTKNR